MTIKETLNEDEKMMESIEQDVNLSPRNSSPGKVRVSKSEIGFPQISFTHLVDNLEDSKYSEEQVVATQSRVGRYAEDSESSQLLKEQKRNADLIELIETEQDEEDNSLVFLSP